MDRRTIDEPIPPYELLYRSVSADHVIDLDVQPGAVDLPQCSFNREKYCAGPHSVLSERRPTETGALAVDYKGVQLDCGYRLDLVVEESILLELKAVERLLPIHQAQVITYLRLSRLPVGLLVNFNATVLRNALRRLTPNHPKSFRSSVLPVRSK